MANTAAFLGAGLLAGVGKGVMDLALEEARTQKEITLRKLDQEFRSSEREATEAFQGGQTDKQIAATRDEGERTRSHARGLLSNTRQFKDQDGMLWQESAGGSAKPVVGPDGKQLKAPQDTPYQFLNGVGADGKPTIVRANKRTGDVEETGVAGSARGAATKDQGELPPGDKRLWDVVKARNTVKDMTGERTDWDAVAAEFKQRGRDDLARLAAPPGSAGKVDTSSPEWRKAEERAKSEASDKAGYFRTDETDFKDDKGSREAFITRRTRELYDEYRGGKREGDAAPKKEASTDSPPAAAKVPPAPRNPADREVGQVYLSPTGKKGEWTGTGWKLVK